FSVDHGDWPDLRYSGTPRFSRSWCHGAPGIALSRIACLPEIDSEETQTEIDRALKMTQQHAMNDADFLCCGTSGVVDILVSAGCILRRKDLLDQASSFAGKVVAEADARGGYALGLPSAGRLRCRGLFQGLAGIGHTLLRLVRPDIVPEVLLLR